MLIDITVTRPTTRAPAKLPSVKWLYCVCIKRVEAAFSTDIIISIVDIYSIDGRSAEYTMIY